MVQADRNRSNLQTNPSFDVNTANYAASADFVMSRDTVIYRTAPGSLHVTQGGAALSSRVEATVLAPAAMPLGTEFEFIFWLRGNAALIGQTFICGVAETAPRVNTQLIYATNPINLAAQFMVVPSRCQDVFQPFAIRGRTVNAGKTGLIMTIGKTAALPWPAGAEFWVDDITMITYPKV